MLVKTKSPGGPREVSCVRLHDCRSVSGDDDESVAAPIRRFILSFNCPLEAATLQSAVFATVGLRNRADTCLEVGQTNWIRPAQRI